TYWSPRLNHQNTISVSAVEVAAFTPVETQLVVRLNAILNVEIRKVQLKARTAELRDAQQERGDGSHRSGTDSVVAAVDAALDSAESRLRIAHPGDVTRRRDLV